VVTRASAYDVRGRVVSATLTVSGAGAWTTQWTYDAADRVTAVTNPDGEVQTTTYDAAGMPLGLESTWPAAGAGTTKMLAANATYNGLGQRSGVAFGNGTSQYWRHYGQETQNWGQQHYGRLRQTCVITTAAACPDDDRDGAATKLSLHYWYDAAGNVRYVDDRSGRWKTAGVWAGPTPTRDAYAYDGLDRLTAWCVNPSAWANCGGSIAGNETYAYDAIGNLTNKDGVGYAYPASGAGSVRPHAVSSTTAGGQFSYDANGNMTSRRITTTAAVQTLTWTAENRLQRVTVGGVTKADFDYDADGVRVRSVANGETTIYAAGGYEVVVAGATALTRTQYYELGGQRIAMRVWRPGTTVTATTWLHGDALGSARAATMLSGAVAAVNPVQKRVLSHFWCITV
jgi:YD repeat-containing protein